VSPSNLLRLASSVTALAADAVEGKPPSPAEIVAVLSGAAEARARVDAEIDAKLGEP
jgi:hypothetical protein